MTSFGEKLKEMRESKGWTVNQLGMYSNVSGASISRYETGERNPPKPPTIKKIAEALKIPNAYNDLMEAAGYIGEGIIKESIDVKYDVDPRRKKLIDEIKNLSDDDAEYVLGLIKRIKKK